MKGLARLTILCLLATGACNCPGSASGADAGPPDSGAAIDSGTGDGGNPRPDAGGSTDSGTLQDAGGFPDAGCSTTGVPTDVLTYHNDNLRTGQYPTEACLTPTTVKQATFGKLFTLSVDGKVDAQPLYVARVAVQGKGTHNVLLVATEHDSVYAFDADSAAGANANPLWKVSVLGAGETPSDNRGCTQVDPEIGVTGTPVIDPGTRTVYLVAMSKNGTTYHQRLHAIDLTSGAEKNGGPIEITGRYPGTGDNSSGGFVVFDPKQYKARPGLALLDNGQVYVAFSSHCDHSPYTGFIMAYDKTTLAQTAIVDLIPNGSLGSIWMAGGGICADASNNLYVLTGNGTFDTTLDANGFPNKQNFGNAFVRIATADGGLSVTDYWTMFNTVSESGADTDLGSGGVMLLPDGVGNAAHPHLCVGAGKDTHIYLVDRDAMGHFNAANNSNVLQDVSGVLPGQGCFSVPAYFNGAIYYGGVGSALQRFTIANAKMSVTAASKSATSFTYPGTFPSVSADGLTSANAIVWAVENQSTAVLRAYLASDLTQELYDSNQAGTRDQFGAGNKYIVPTIANGKVYVGTTNGVGVFGLF